MEDEMCPELKKMVEKYISEVTPRIIQNDKCPICGAELFGLVGQLMGSGFQWGIIHGHGFCGRCRVGVKLYHYVEHEHPGKLCRWRQEAPVIQLKLETIPLLRAKWIELFGEEFTSAPPDKDNLKNWNEQAKEILQRATA